MTLGDILDVLNRSQPTLKDKQRSACTVQVTDHAKPESTVYNVSLSRTYNAEGYITGWIITDIQPPPDEE